MSFSRLYIALIVTGGLHGLCVGGSNIDPEDIIFHIHGPDTTSKIGTGLTPLGDINNDGFGDVAINCLSPRGVYIFNGGNPMDSFPDLFYEGYLGAITPIDLDGDAINEFISFDIDDSLGARRGRIYFFRGFEDSLASVPYDSLTPDSLRHHLCFRGGGRTGFVDSDQYGDLLSVEGDSPGGPTVLYYSGCPEIDKEFDWSYKINGYSHVINEYDFIDFNGDGNQDIILGLGALKDDMSYIYIFFGPDFPNEPNVKIDIPIEFDIQFPQTDFPKHLSNIGDYDGDGWDDLGVIVRERNSSPHPLVYFCGPTYDTLYDYILNGYSDNIEQAGDINGDGFNDLIGGGSGDMFGRIYLYLGGPKADANYDEQISSNDLPPLFLDDIGNHVCSAGDVNNDGYDDILFSCLNFAYGDPGDVFIMEGSDKIPTAINGYGSGSPDIPRKLELDQNYPNPFNPSTTIKYSLLKRTDVRLNIYDILGRQVVTLVDDTKPAGEYEITWDGKDASGKPVASGIYFYCLEADGVSESRKMILLK